MIFLTNTDITTYADQVDIDVITNNDNTNLDKLELASIEEMSDYLNVNYDPAAVFAATGTERNNSIIMRLVDMLLYHAHASIMPDNIPQLRVERYNQAVGWLEKVADGFIAPNLPIKEEEPTTPRRYGNSQDKIDQYF